LIQKSYEIPDLRQGTQAKAVTSRARSRASHFTMAGRVLQGVLVIISTMTGLAFAGDNGVARTPPMGWRSW
jgi:hypothetical protein